jgi:hypothetical protein
VPPGGNGSRSHPSTELAEGPTRRTRQAVTGSRRKAAGTPTSGATCRAGSSASARRSSPSTAAPHDPRSGGFSSGAIIIDLIGAIIGRAAHAVAIQYIIYVLVAIGTVSLAVRRLHDSGKSGFWWLIGFIPVIGTITLIVFYCLSGTP